MGNSAEGLYFWGPENGGDYRIGNLIFDEVRTSIPARTQNHLCVAEIGQGVQRDLPYAPPAPQRDRQNQPDASASPSHRQINQPVDHLVWRTPPASTSLACASNCRWHHAEQQ